MASNLVLLALLLVRLDFHFVRSQEAVTPENICEFPLNNETWFAAGLNEFPPAPSFGDIAAIAQVGYQNFLLDLLPAALIDAYICESEAQCDLGPLVDNCAQNPLVASHLKAMANWSNYWQSMIDSAREVADFVGSQAGRIVDLFNPEKEEPPPEFVPNQARIGLVFTNLMLGIVSVFPPLSPLAAGIGLVKDFSTTTQGILAATSNSAKNNPAVTERYDQFADIVASTGALAQGVTEGLRQYIRDQLNSVNLFEAQNVNSNIIFQTEGGDFAEPIGDLGTELRNRLTAAIAAPAINRLWNSMQVVVVEAAPDAFAPDAFSNDFFICFGDNIIPANRKVCADELGSARMLLKIPRDLEALQATNPDTNLVEAANFELPGLDNLAEFSLDLAGIIQKSIDNQAQNGYLGAAATDEGFIEELVALDELQLDVFNMIFFNLPVCFLPERVLTPNQEGFCFARFPLEANACFLYTALICACPGQFALDVEWPYQTSGAPQCGLSLST